VKRLAAIYRVTKVEPADPERPDHFGFDYDLQLIWIDKSIEIQVKPLKTIIHHSNLDYYPIGYMKCHDEENGQVLPLRNATPFDVFIMRKNQSK